jgi:hypothetical protein
MRKRTPKRKPIPKQATKVPEEYRGILNVLRERKPSGGTVTLERYAVTKSLGVDIRP